MKDLKDDEESLISSTGLLKDLGQMGPGLGQIEKVYIFIKDSLLWVVVV